jgi:hypothetical protein
VTPPPPTPEPASGQKPQRTLKEIVEDNIIITIVIAAVATGSVVAGTMVYLTTQHENILTATCDDKITGLTQTQNIATAKHDAEVRELKLRITDVTRLTRSLGGTLDVGKMFLTQNDLQSTCANQNIRYFPERQYCAPNNIKELKYERMPAALLLRDLSGSAAVPHNMSDAIAAYSVDVWKGKAMPVRGTSYSRFFPFIAVRQVTKEQIVEMGQKMGIFVEQNKLSPKSANVSDNTQHAPTDTSIEGMTLFLQNESAGNLAALFVTANLLSLFVGNIDFNVLQIQQLGPVMHTKFLEKFHNINVNNVEYSTYYTIQELFVFARDNGELFSISTFLPTENAAGNETSAAINEWLSAFRVVGF